jgi:hypothetical protein
VKFLNDIKYKMQAMGNQQPDIETQGEQRLQKRLQMIDTLKAPIIEMGRNLGYEVVEDYDLGAGPIHVCCTFKQVQNPYLI